MFTTFRRILLTLTAGSSLIGAARLRPADSAIALCMLVKAANSRCCRQPSIGSGDAA